MRIGILGAGRVGGTLGQRWALAGHEVMFGVRNATSSKVQSVLAAAGPTARVGTVVEAIAFGDVILLAIPWTAVRAVVDQAETWRNKILIDATNRLVPSALGDAPSGAEDISEWAQGAPVVKAFNATGSDNMAGHPYGDRKVDIYMCGDDESAKAVVGLLARDIGFDVIDCGPLANAVLLEAMARLWIHLAYTQGLGADIALKLLGR